MFWCHWNLVQTKTYDLGSVSELEPLVPRAAEDKTVQLPVFLYFSVLWSWVIQARSQIKDIKSSYFSFDIVCLISDWWLMCSSNCFPKTIAYLFPSWHCINTHFWLMHRFNFISVLFGYLFFFSSRIDEWYHYIFTIFETCARIIVCKFLNGIVTHFIIYIKFQL